MRRGPDAETPLTGLPAAADRPETMSTTTANAANVPRPSPILSPLVRLGDDMARRDRCCGMKVRCNARIQHREPAAPVGTGGDFTDRARTSRSFDRREAQLARKDATSRREPRPEVRASIHSPRVDAPGRPALHAAALPHRRADALRAVRRTAPRSTTSYHRRFTRVASLRRPSTWNPHFRRA